MLIVITLIVVYLVFHRWYGGRGQPLRPEETQALLQQLQSQSHSAQSEAMIESVRKLADADDGREFVMHNLARYRRSAQYPADHPDAKDPDPRAADRRYGRALLPELLRRACLPVFIARCEGALHETQDHERWDYVAMVRYRSLRDFLRFAVAIEHKGIAVHKWAALEDTRIIAVRPLISLIFVRAVVAALLGLLALAASSAHAQGTWPQRPVRIVVPYGPGSSPDVMARILAERLGPRLGQPVLVENRAGAGGNLGTGAVAKAAPDGQTFVISTNGPLVNNTVLYSKLPYDPFRDLAPVVLAGGQANVCAVRSDAGIDSLQALVKAMRARPGGFNFSSIGVGSLSHLGVELLKVRTGSFAVHIPYPSSPAAITALLQGDVQFSCVPAVAVMPQVRAGKLKALAVSTGNRSALMPEVPTMKESGLPEVEAVAWMALMAPAGTPAEIIARLNREVNALLASAEVRERMHSQYMEPIGGSPEQLAAFMQRERELWTPIIRRSGATVD